jgi:DNA-directed RNA polymerase subunit RPC12/RpoP
MAGIDTGKVTYECPNCGHPIVVNAAYTRPMNCPVCRARINRERDRVAEETPAGDPRQPAGETTAGGVKKRPRKPAADERQSPGGL